MSGDTAKASGPIKKGSLVLMEMPMIFESLVGQQGDVPKKIEDAPFLIKFVYHILVKKRGGKRVADYFGRFQRTELVGIAEKYVGYLRFFMDKFSGIKMNILLMFIRLAEETSYYTISPVLGLPMGLGLYENLPVFKHSCEPNAYYYCRISDGKVFVKVLRDIDEGESVTIPRHENLHLIVDVSLRRQLLRKKFNIQDCDCPRCVNEPPPPYDIALKKLTVIDSKNSKLPKDKIEVMMEELESFAVSEEGIYIIDQFWRKFGGDIHCPLTKLRMARSYASAFLGMTTAQHGKFEEIQGLATDGCISGLEEDPDHADTAMMRPEDVGKAYEASIVELEKLRFLDRKSLIKERIRLYLFQALLAMPNAGVKSFSIAALTPQTIRFVQLYSTALDLAERYWGNENYILAEAEMGFETLAAIMGVGKQMEQAMSEWGASREN